MERMTLYFVLCMFCWIHFHECLGSEVKLTATPSTVTNGLTESFKLRCSLETGAPILSNYFLYFFPIYQDTTDASSVVVGRQVSSTSYDIEHVNSIIISRVNPNETVTSLAEIITSENAKVVGDLENVTVVGTLTPSDPGDPEYLELTWTDPGAEQSGIYICEVNGLDPQGHCVMLQKNMAVNSADPEVRDLVKEFNNLKATVERLTSQIQELDKENNDLKATVDGLTSQIQDLVRENNDLKATVDGLTSQIQDVAIKNNELKAIVATHKAPHTEGGIVYCGNSDSWPILPGTSVKQLVVPVTFKQPYSSPPVISVASVGEDFVLDDRNQIGYQWWGRDVTTTGFNIYCRTWSGGHYGGKDIGWTSILA